jgi:hypothetical protein
VDSRLVLPFNTVLADDYRIRRVVGSGGFGITYEAEDINLGTVVAVKEYYPLDFAERGATMSVVPKSERHKPTFERGRSSFLQEARTLARFEHPSIVRVTRVFEWNSNAYMVMRFEHGVSFEAWLKSLGRPPTQAELDTILAPLLGALEMMHTADFLHRDIAPDNIIVRADGTPVLLDFGAARRTVAEMSRSLTGIVKAGYSPHEQYSSDGRLQGPWSDLYALGATLYRAVAGKAPEDAILRVDEDQMTPAAQAAKGQYRRDFLAAIDTCLKVRQAERPRSVAQLRPMLLGGVSQARTAEPAIVQTRAPAPTVPVPPQAAARRGTWRWSAAAALVAILGGAYGGLEFQRRHAAGNAAGAPVVTLSIEAEAARDRKRQAELEIERRQKEKEAADARQRQVVVEEERRRKAEADAEAARSEQARIAALQEAQRRAEEARRKAEADDETKRKEEQRVAALEEERRSEERRKEAERVRLATIPDDGERAEFVRKVQQLLKRGGCYAGALTGRSADAQEAADKFVENVRSRGKATPQSIKLAKANVGDFESWLRDAESVKGTVCAAKPRPEQQEKPQRPRETPQAQAAAKSPGNTAGNDRPGRGGSCSNWMFYNTSCVDAGGRLCRQTTAGRKCD